MPHLEIERLSSGSEDQQVKAAISSCIATEVRAGRSQEEAAGMCYGMARDKTGKALAPKEGS